MKKATIVSLSLSVSLMLTALSCSTENITGKEEATPTTQLKITKNALDETGKKIYFLSQDDLTSKCLLTSSGTYNVTTNNYPVINTPKWYGTTLPGGAWTSKDDLYFETLRNQISAYYHTPKVNIEYNVYNIPAFDNDLTISKANVNIYPTYPYYDFVPDTSLSTSTSTEVMHALFTRIDDLVNGYGKPLHGATLYINGTMCGSYSGMGVQLYFK